MAVKRDFLDRVEAGDKLGYLDGFRFGFGFFIAWLLGSAIVGVVVVLSLSLMR